MSNIRINIEKIAPLISPGELKKVSADIFYNYNVLMGRSGPGNDFLGWMDLPDDWNEKLSEKIQSDVALFRNLAEVVVVVGIGGSYLGARAVIEALKKPFEDYRMGKSHPVIIYAGQHLSGDYLTNLLELLDMKDYAMVVISKSGTTTEPAIAFRVIRDHMEKKYGKKAAKTRIIAITDASCGALKQMAEMEGYSSYVIPDNVGGRFSVLTPVGLLPIAIAGYNIDEFIQGAIDMQRQITSSSDPEENPAVLYAAARNALYRRGNPIEVLVSYEPALFYLTEWWKQLFGESEGKDHKGIFPAGVNFTTDLHSMGQYLQDGLRVLFETVITIEKPSSTLRIPLNNDDYDGLNFLAGKEISYVNKMASLGTLLAHHDGGVPIIRLSIPEISERYLGELIYFFEFACALSGYSLDVNPFDQPGVEAYKRNMFALLGKPGFEDETKEIRRRI